MGIARLAQIAVLALVPASASGAEALEWISRVDLTVDETQRLVDELPGRGFVPIYSKATVYAGDDLRFDVVFLKPLDVEWQFRRYDDATFQVRNRELLDQGFKQVSYQAYEIGGQTYHNCIWHKPNP